MQPRIRDTYLQIYCYHMAATILISEEPGEPRTICSTPSRAPARLDGGQSSNAIRW
jgi:hypothetical protein